METREEYDARNKAEWNNAIIESFGNTPPQSAQWVDADGMINILTPFMGKSLNHTMLPRGGGQDMMKIKRSAESGCLELCVSDKSAEIFHPGHLYFEYFPESPWNSFFLLEAEELAACGVYEESNGESEEVLELDPSVYTERYRYDQGFLRYDENGDEIPLPDSYRIVTRYLKGKFMIVAKRSLWNRVSGTYDGRHAQLSASEIRKQIQAVIDRQDG